MLTVDHIRYQMAVAVLLFGAGKSLLRCFWGLAKNLMGDLGLELNVGVVSSSSSNCHGRAKAIGRSSDVAARFIAHTPSS